jgi:hypothetical protein
MSPGTISLYALAALLGLAPAILRTTLTRAGVKLGPKDRASESDLARVFGPSAARSLVERVRSQGLSRQPSGEAGSLNDGGCNTSPTSGRARGHRASGN